MIRDDWRHLGDTCGEYPAASSFASAPFTPLTPEQSAAYNAARQVYNACKQTAAGAPQEQCPPDSTFQGGQDQFGTWQGRCISSFTGQSTTDLITTGPKTAPASPPPPVAPPIATPPPPTPARTSPTIPTWAWGAAAVALYFFFK